MIDRLINSFKRTDGDEQRAFQAKVVAILRDLHPESAFTSNEDALMIDCDESQLGLTNLKANFLQTTQTDQDLRELIADTLSVAIIAVKDVDKSHDWNAAKGRLMPQLMPAAYLERMPLVSRPFGDIVVVGYVLDSEKAYSYVGSNELAEWNVEADEVHEIAIENLDQRSKGLEATFTPGDNGLIAVAGMDGFDATRILLTGLREKFAESLSVEEFFFGIPNRDFLICWSPKGDAEFQSQMRGQIESDSESQPYPLSSKTFIARSNGEIEVEESYSEVDPRVETANLN